MAKQGTHFVLSPANLAYLDMKYTAATPLGQDWAGLIEAKTAYNWDPGKYLTGVDANVGQRRRGVRCGRRRSSTLADIQYMAFPRLAELAELGWSQAATHDWNTFKNRLAAQGPRWKAQGVNFYASPQVPWVK